jgi:hypothetical protein
MKFEIREEIGFETSSRIDQSNWDSAIICYDKNLPISGEVYDYEEVVNLVMYIEGACEYSTPPKKSIRVVRRCVASQKIYGLRRLTDWKKTGEKGPVAVEETLIEDEEGRLKVELREEDGCILIVEMEIN